MSNSSKKKIVSCVLTKLLKVYTNNVYLKCIVQKVAIHACTFILHQNGYSRKSDVNFLWA